jgi:hypothetical protein
VQTGSGSAAELHGRVKGISISGIAAVRLRRSSIENAEKLDHQPSEKVQNRDGQANEQGEGKKYFEKGNGRGARLREIRQQGQDRNKCCAESHRASRRCEQAATRGVAKKKKRTRPSRKPRRALREVPLMIS